jgi:CHAT domain-containing protein/Tfp pilus assembly protein PilF
MQRVLAVTVLSAWCAACATVTKAPTDTRLEEAQEALEEARRQTKAGEYAEAGALAQRALELREAILGRAHPEVADCLELLSSIHLSQGGHERAEPLLLRSLDIREAASGKNHLDVAYTLSNLAHLYENQGQYARAQPLYERALAILEAALGVNHSDVAFALSNLAGLYKDQGQYARAQPLYERALVILEAALGENHPEVAFVLNNHANLYLDQQQYAQAEALIMRALAIREVALGKDHPDVAGSLNSLAVIYKAQGQYARAVPLLERALALREAALGKNHPDIASSLNNLAFLYEAQGQFTRAKPLYERALAIREAVLGKDHPDVAVSLNNLAFLLGERGQYAQAEPLYERALAIWEAVLGKDHPNVASSLNNLATLYEDQGQYSRAEPLYERALAIREAALGKDHPDVAVSLNNLASLYHAQRQYLRAELLLERALAIAEAAHGRNHPNVAALLSSLAGLYKAQGQYARAGPLYERALAIWEAALGKEHPLVAISLKHHAVLYHAQGQYARAMPFYERARAIFEATLGKRHPKSTTLLQHLAELHLDLNHLNLALPLLEQSFLGAEEQFRQEVFGYSEERLASVLQLLRADEERLYALVRAHPDDPRVRQLALSAALLRKGRSVEEIAVTSRLISQGLSQAERETFERLRALRTQLANLSLAGPGQRTPVDYQQHLKALMDEGDDLEAELARRSEPLRAFHALPSHTELLERVASALPQDGALVEFIAYSSVTLVPNAGAPVPKKPGELRYLALLLFDDGRTHAFDLGPAEPIDRAAVRLHDALVGRAVAYQPAAQELYARAFRPLVPHLGKVRKVFLSPDGQLALAPFVALHDGKQFLVDSWDISYLTSGKDLLRRPTDDASAREVVVLADPDFSVPPSMPPNVAQASSFERLGALDRFFSTVGSKLADSLAVPLPGTRQEAEAIQRLFPHARLLLGRDATKEALLKLTTPGLLHIATHGFFLEDAPIPEATRGVVHPGLVNSGPRQRPPDPLLRSGLLLAGSRAPDAQPGVYRREDSLVTALELAGMDLWGTQLVVLSACDTGRGDVKQGQGVYGLRRAFAVAGAETMVTSLWKVNDETTRELMEGYYRNLLAGQGRTAALREAMKELRKKKPHPYYWAPFIAIGQDGPLRGLDPR